MKLNNQPLLTKVHLHLTRQRRKDSRVSFFQNFPGPGLSKEVWVCLLKDWFGQIRRFLGVLQQYFIRTGLRTDSI